MSIIVTLKDTHGGEFYDALTGVSLRGTDKFPSGGIVVSGDLSGLDCRGIIAGLAQDKIVLTEGYLGPVYVEGEITNIHLSDTYNFLGYCHRKVKKILFSNLTNYKEDGTSTTGFILDLYFDQGASNPHLAVQPGGTFEWTFDIPIPFLTVEADDGAVFGDSAGGYTFIVE